MLNNLPETGAIPFIFLTAKNETADLRKGMGLGTDDYLTKPFDELQLLKAIKSRPKKKETQLPFIVDHSPNSIHWYQETMASPN